MMRDNKTEAILETDKIQLLKYRADKARDKKLGKLELDVREMKYKINMLSELVRNLGQQKDD